MLSRSFRYIFIFIFLLAVTRSSAQSNEVDSLSGALARATSDVARIDLHTKLANALIAHNYSDALSHATKAVDIAERSQQDSLRIKAYRVAGAVSMFTGLNELAVRYFNLQAAVSEKSDNPSESGAAYFNLGAVYMALEDHNKALEFMNLADKQLREGYQRKNEPMPDIILLMYRMNMANIYLHLGVYDRSDSMIGLCMSMVNVLPGMESKRLSLYHIKAQLHLKMNQPDSALSALGLSRTLAESLGDQSGYTATCISAGEAYEQKQDFSSAIREYTDGYRRAERINGLALKQLTAEHLYKLYRKTGKTDSAARYFELFTTMQQESKNIEAKEALMREDLQRKYDRMTTELSQRDEQRKRGYLTAILIILLASIVAWTGFFFYRRRYRRLQLDRIRREVEAKRLSLEMERLQAELDHRDTELERINTELKKTSLIEGLVANPEEPGSLSGRKILDIDSIKAVLSSDLKTKAWDEFEYRFQQIHSGFYDRLRQSHPDLTLNERRLCAFLRLDMTTKEISDITGQTPGAINMARIRLRRKLGLTHDNTELFEFLSSL